MRRNENYIMRQIAGEHILIPTGSVTAELSGMVSFSETSAFVWEQLSEEKNVAELVQAVTESYEVSEEQARGDIENLLGELNKLRLLENI